MANLVFSIPLLRPIAAGIALQEAARGVRETSPNWSKEIRLYLLNCDPPIKAPVPWCAAAVQYITDRACRQAGIANPLDAVKREAYVPDYFELAKDKGWVIPPTMADVGDLVLYQFNVGPRRWNHIGIVIKPPNAHGAFEACEGNTGDPNQNQRDGDGFYLKERSVLATYKTCFVRWDRDVRIPPDARIRLAA